MFVFFSDSINDDIRERLQFTIHRPVLTYQCVPTFDFVLFDNSSDYGTVFHSTYLFNDEQGISLGQVHAI